jgi:hypothetical protein
MGKKYGGEINLTARFYGLDGIFGRDILSGSRLMA